MKKWWEVFEPSQKLQQSVAYTIDYRGGNDNLLSFVFRGTTTETLRNVFSFLCPKNKEGVVEKGIAKGFVLQAEHDILSRNGKGYRRLSVILDTPDLNFASIDDMCLLIEARLKAEVKAEITRMDLDTFLNI